MAIRMVPGFVGRKLYSARLVWATVWLGNAAAVLRVLPLFLPSSRVTVALLGLAGLLVWPPFHAWAGTSGRRSVSPQSLGQGDRALRR